jgi:hypothetical protein
LESDEINERDIGYNEAGSNEVDGIAWCDDKVYINDKQHFSNVPRDAWEFFVGGYQPAQKWLKVRRGSVLNSDDVEHYAKIVCALVLTRQIMSEIDVVGV